MALLLSAWVPRNSLSTSLEMKKNETIKMHAAGDETDGRGM
jgi:hypothetical protein